LYDKQIRVKIKIYRKNKIELDLNFKLAGNLRSRTSLAFKSQNVKKMYKPFDLIGCSHSFFQRWIIQQLYGKMTLENYCIVWCIDHCYPLSKTNLSNETNRRKSTIWITLRPMYINENSSKGSKINQHLYLLQQIKAKYFLN